MVSEMKPEPYAQDETNEAGSGKNAPQSASLEGSKLPGTQNDDLRINSSGHSFKIDEKHFDERNTEKRKARDTLPEENMKKPKTAKSNDDIDNANSSKKQKANPRCDCFGPNHGYDNDVRFLMDHWAKVHLNA